MPDLVSFVAVTSVYWLALSDNLAICVPLETTKSCEACESEVCKERACLLKASINESLDPCDDFYSFVCHGWINQNPIPPEAQSYGTFEQTDQLVMHELKELIENITDLAEPYNVTQKAAVVYRTCLQNNFTDQQLIALWGDLIVSYGLRAWPIVESRDVPYSSYVELLTNTSLWPIYSVAVALDIQDNGRYIIELDEMPFPVLGREQLVNPNATEHNRKVVQRYVYLIATAILILNRYATTPECLGAAEQIFAFESQLAKLEKMTNKIGYPERIYDDDYMESRFRFVGDISLSEPFALIMTKYGKNSAIMEMLQLRSTPNKSTTWARPAVVNAYYSFGNNEMAGILRGAFYRHGLPDSVNYGGIGSVTGHEMIHGFDDKGSQFDEDGRLRDWWTNDTRRKFDEKADCFVRQYSAEFSDLANRTLNGINTLGENIADNGGLRMAYRVWCGSIRQKALQLKIEYDPHAPKRHRVNVSLKDMKSFTAAFQCNETSRMHYKDNETCVMW